MTSPENSPENNPAPAESGGNSYRSILKGTSIFGGVQFFQILMSLVRGKFVAILLGPAGMGVNALFSTAGQSLSMVTSLGLNLAVVKEVAAAKEDRRKLGAVVATTRRLITATAILGALVTFLLAGWLSRISFGSEEYAPGFRLLSLFVFLTLSGNGLLSVLQGLHEVKRLSRATLAGGAAGLFIGVPLYYFFGTDGIVPGMVAMALATFLFYRISAGKTVGRPGERYSWRDNMPLMRRLLLTGLIFLSGDLLGTLGTYVLNLYIRWSGSLADVGFFQAANSLTLQYSGMLFTAMMLDYFPRLSAAAGDNAKVNTIVGRQMEIVALLAAPMIALLILFIPVVIQVLLTQKFAGLAPLIRWMGVGVMLKAFMYPLGYITFAKDNRRLYFWMEAIGANGLTFLLNCAGYKLFGLIGLGYAQVVDCAICLVVYSIVNYRLYRVRMSGKCLRTMALGAAGVALTFAASFLCGDSPVAAYTLMTIFAATTLLLSLRKLKRLLAK